jgi:hypothetical protein
MKKRQFLCFGQTLEKSKYALKLAFHWALRNVLCTSVTISYEWG